MTRQNETGGAGRLVAVVVTHNRLHQLEITLARLLDAPPAHLAAVVVVDNASSDDTPAWLRAQDDPRLHPVFSDRNLGGAGGFEIGMRHAVETLAPDWMVVMDDDARPEPVCLAAFHAADRSGFDAWCSAVFHLDGRICDMNRPAINPFWHRDVLRRTALGGGREAFHFGEAEMHGTEQREIDISSFVGMFVSGAIVSRIGYPDGSLFIYGDDTLYSLGLRKAGGRICFDPSLRFEHDFTTMVGGEKRHRPIWKTYYHHRNLLMVYRLASGWFFIPALFAVIPKWLSKVRLYKGERLIFLRLILRAIWHGLLRKTDVSHEDVLSWTRN